MAKEMKFESVSPARFTGFFQYEEGNIVTGEVIDQREREEEDNGKTVVKGFIVFKDLMGGCTILNGTATTKSQSGDIVAVPILAATKCMLGHFGKIFRVTYEGMEKTKNKKFHKILVEKAS